MIRKRFPGSRIARIRGWTAIATAWATVGIQVAATGDQADPPPAPETPVEAQTATPQASIPAMPEGGLVVIRYTPSPVPEPTVVTRIVEQRVVVQQASKPASSGS